jgi:hypothetical protein
VRGTWGNCRTNTYSSNGDRRVSEEEKLVQTGDDDSPNQAFDDDGISAKSKSQ